VTRLANGAGVVSFAGTGYQAGRRWARQAIDVSIVAGSVQRPGTARSSGCTRSGTTGPASPARSPTPKAGPAARTPPPGLPPSYRNPDVARVPELDREIVFFRTDGARLVGPRGSAGRMPDSTAE
jgi:hypothetical protein